MLIAGAFLSTMMPAMGPAFAQFPARSQIRRLPVSEFAVSVPAGTLVFSVKVASPGFARPDPESLAEQPRVTSVACQSASGLAHMICGGVVSVAPLTERLACAVFPLSLAVTVCEPAVAAVHIAPVHEPSGEILKVVVAVTSPILLLKTSKACAV